MKIEAKTIFDVRRLGRLPAAEPLR